MEAPIEKVGVCAYEVPTEQPESDGTLVWESVTLVLVQIDAGGETGLGYTYADQSAATLVSSKLAEVVKGRDALAVPGAWWAMVHAIRNLGWPGISATAISAVDIALWDLKAKLLGLGLADLLGRAHDSVPIYGSGGLTSYSDRELRRQFEEWVTQGIPRVKMKIGRDPDADPARVRAAREAIGPRAELYVDANGAYDRKQALAQASWLREEGVCWLEEPVSSNDLEGLRLLRDQGPPGMAIAAGEYGYEPGYFRRMLEAGAVDVLQADATRCCGITGMQAVGALCTAHEVPFSAHCAPAVNAPVACALGRTRHCEYFHTHARVERLLFDGVLEPSGGRLRPDPDRLGLGLELKRGEADRFAL
jgi:L-alanine-DL-glutamate epimerase-like enolase superfamily enzyme